MHVVTAAENIPVERKVQDLLRRVENIEVKDVGGGGGGGGGDFDGTLYGALTVNGTGTSKIMGNLMVEGTSHLKGTITTPAISSTGTLQITNGLTTTTISGSGNLTVGGNATVAGTLTADGKNVGTNLGTLNTKTQYISYSNPDTIITSPLSLKGANETLMGTLKAHTIIGDDENDAHEVLVLRTTEHIQEDELSGHIIIKTGTSLGGGPNKQSGNIEISTGIVGLDERGQTGHITIATGVPMGGSATRGNINLSAHQVNVEGNTVLSGTLKIGGENGVELSVVDGHLLIGGVEVWSSSDEN
jgi:hypothetical protein